MKIVEKAQKILKQPICDHCFGRQFAQLLHGYSNCKRGKIIRTKIAMSIDREKAETDMDMSNFHNFKFHNLETGESKSRKCSVCNNIFDNLDKYINNIVKKSKKIDFKTFLIGTKLSHDLLSKEEDLWERVGIDYCEPLKAELNREIGKIVEKKTKSTFEPKNPDVNFIINLKTAGNIDIITEINPLFIYGEYQKLKRGIPQTRWPTGKYKTSIEQIIAKPYMPATKGKGHKFHGLGREDIDALCFAWRPFVLEISEPKKRKINLGTLAKKIGKEVRIKNLRFSNIQEVRKIKEARIDKTYKASIICDKRIKRADLKKLKRLVTQIKQKTPKRVLHRRADRVRKRKVKVIKTKFINSKKFELTVKGEAGLYVKELISSDSGRTKPNVSETLNCKCTCKELDVIKIEKMKGG